MFVPKSTFVKKNEQAMTDKTPFNDLAKTAILFKRECNKIDFVDWMWNEINLRRYFKELESGSKDATSKPGGDPSCGLSSLLDTFRELQLDDNYVLDGFMSGIQGFGYEFHLQVHTKDAKRFIPPNWDVNLLQMSSDEKRKRIEHLDRYNEDNFIRNGVHYEECKYIEKETIWNHMTVPFTERGIWEATLLYTAPHMLPCFWHAMYESYEIICSDSNLSKRDKKNKFIGSTDLHPKVIINGNEAVVLFTEWGWNGLRQHMIMVERKGRTVKFTRDVATFLDYQKSFICL